MAVAEPQLGLRRSAGEQRLVDADRAGKVAEQRENRRLERQVGGFARLARQQAVHLGEGGRSLLAAKEHHGEVVPRPGETRR